MHSDAAKVFRVLWPELAGNPNEGTVLSQGKFNEPVHMKIRWFVVIREGPNYCSCIPIQTYSGQGAAKPGLQIWEHAIIYTGDREPRPKEGEKPSPDTHGMQPSIRVKPRTRSDRMDEMSRVNFAKIYTVEHNVKVFEFGDVRPEFMKRLLKNFVAVWDIAEFRNEEASGDEQEEGAGQGDSAEDNDDDDDNDYDDDTTGGSEAQEPSQGMARHNYRLAHWIQYLRSANQGAQADQLQTAPYPQQVQIMERYGAASGTSGRGKQPQR